MYMSINCHLLTLWCCSRS